MGGMFVAASVGTAVGGLEVKVATLIPGEAGVRGGISPPHAANISDAVKLAPATANTFKNCLRFILACGPSINSVGILK